ncbi:hypothetical protein ABW21_db0200742 [Orbilia brochopaga]|nr:hypothetical protein ABW21_db0200742 [Drechslerella brochopaga]
MRLLSLVLGALASTTILASPIPASRLDGHPGAEIFPGDAFLHALELAGPSVPTFAARLPLPATSIKTCRYLKAFRTATLALNITDPVNFLDESREFQYPVFNNMRCELGKDDNGVLPFVSDTTLGNYFESLFRMIPVWTKGAITLSRFDLFHAHLFANPATKVAGVVFHAKEYPAGNTASFPFDLGFCQLDSNVTFVDEIMRKRNLVWMIDAKDRASLWWIDMGAKTGDPAVDEVTGGAPFYTLYEDSLGHVVADFYYLEGLKLGISLY